MSDRSQIKKFNLEDIVTEIIELESLILLQVS